MAEAGGKRTVLRGLAAGLALVLTALALLGGLVTLCSPGSPDPNRSSGSAVPQVQQIGRQQLRPAKPSTTP